MCPLSYVIVFCGKPKLVYYLVNYLWESITFELKIEVICFPALVLHLNSGIEKCAFEILLKSFTAQKMKFSIKDFFSKCHQIRSFLRIWSDLLKKSLMENFIFLCSVFKVLCHCIKHARIQVFSRP